MRRLAPLVLAALALAGCGSSNEQKTPVACLGGPKFFYSALRTPADPTFSGQTLISDCLVKNQGAGELANIGTAVVRTATQLNAKARQNPTGITPFRLGYLVGALTRGAADTGGVHAVLLQRVTAAARYSPSGRPLPQGFSREYEKGYADGRDHG